MKKILILVLFLMVPFVCYSQTLTLSGSSINLEIVSLADSVAVLTDFISATGDTLTDVHKKIETRTFGVIDTLTAIHSKLETRTKTLPDTLTSIHTRLAKIASATGILYEQSDAAVNITAIADSGITVLNLRTANTRYVIRNLRLKCADPGANTVTITLWEFINDAFIAVDTFAITTSNYTTYFNLYDMFGETQLAGDSIMIMAQSGAGSYAVTGQYSYAKTNN